MNNKKNKIARVILLGFISITIISILVSGVFWVVDIFSIYQDEIKTLKAEFINDQKFNAKSEVEDVVEFIQYSRSRAEINLKKDLKNRLYIAHDIAVNIYNENKNSKSIEEIKDLIKDALRPIRFNEGRGYYFAAGLDGVDELYPVYPELEGTDISDLQDEMGNFVVRNELEIVNQQGEGYLIDFWKKPELNDGMIYPKITFVKKFEQLNWYLGTGDYLDEFEEDIKQEILERLSDIRFGAEGYIFVNKFDGTQLITNGELVKTHKNLKDLVGTDGVELLEKELLAANQLEGDFITYSFNKMGGTELSSKISFIKGIKDWEWIIGAGFYEDDLSNEIESIEFEKKNQVKKNLLQIVIIVFILLTLSIIISRMILLKIRKNFKIFEDFFKSGLDVSEKIDVTKLDYNEFHRLAEYFNTMIDEIVEERKIIIKNELKYKNLVENQGEGVVIGDLEENLEFANPAASRILGTTVEDLQNRTLKDFLPEEDFQKVKNQTKNRIEGISSTYELNMIRSDGEMRQVMITATPLYDHTKKVIGSIGIFRDITEWNKAKQELEKNRHLLKLVNKILRHDLTNYLVAIQSGLNLYSKHQTEEFLDETYKKIDTSIELIRKMKEFESIEYIDQKLIFCDTDEIFSKFAIMYPEIEIEVIGKCNIKANESIHSVFNNIITNAIHHGGADKIIIEIIPGDGNCEIKIRDFGIGIQDKYKERIFEEGFKRGKTGKSGLGLFIVKEALSMMDATIEVTDNEPNGTTFILNFQC